MIPDIISVTLLTQFQLVSLVALDFRVIIWQTFRTSAQFYLGSSLLSVSIGLQVQGQV